MEIGRFISFAGKLNMACPFVHQGESACVSLSQPPVRLGSDKLRYALR